MNLFDLLLATPLIAGAILSVIGHRPRATLLNIAASAVTLAAALALAYQVLERGPYTAHGQAFFLDAYNVFLISLTAFVATTTAIFSAPYMRHELAIGRVTAERLRLYHAMYQLFIFGMYLGLTTNNLGVLWIALELATLATVLLVSLYRTPRLLVVRPRYMPKMNNWYMA